jgi:primosomal protein N' (replication factor Y)
VPIFSLTGGLSQDDQVKTIKKLHREHVPRIIISTAPFITATPASTSTVVVEFEGSEHYTIPESRIQTNEIVQKYCEYSGVKFILADTFLSIKTHLKMKEGAYHSETTPVTRLSSHAKISYIDLHSDKKEIRKWNLSSGLFSQKTLSEIALAIEEKKTIVVYATQAGHSSMTLCQDCGSTVACPKCESSLSLYVCEPKSLADRPLRSYSCRSCDYFDPSPPHECSQCHGHRFVFFGYGTERICQELKMLFPATSPVVLDRKQAKTQKKVLKILEQWKESEGMMLVTTSSYLNHPTITADITIVPSLQSLSGSDGIYDAPRNSGARTLVRLLEQTTEHFIVQTHNGDDPLKKLLKSRSLAYFIKEELETRERLSMPPFRKTVQILLDFQEYLHPKAFSFIEDLIGNYGKCIFVPGSSVGSKSTVRIIFNKDFPSRGESQNHPADDIIKTLCEEFSIQWVA